MSAILVQSALGAAGSEVEHCAMTLTADDAAMIHQRLKEGDYDMPEGVIDGTYIIPLALHVVRTSAGEGGLSEFDLAQSIIDLNIAFEPAGMQFCDIGHIHYIDSDAFYFGIDSMEDIDALRSTGSHPSAVNVYFTEVLPGLCGISSFTFHPVQGIVMANDCTAASGNGTTLVHEVGHYFDLYHTHETFLGIECTDGTNCDEAGDLICDTPADPLLHDDNVSTECEYIGAEIPVCPLIGSSGFDPDVLNYMSYSWHFCRAQLTPEQCDRMRASLLKYRPELAQSACLFSDFPSPVQPQVLSTGIDDYVANDHSTEPSMTEDGSLVTFSSRAQDLDASAATPYYDIYIRDLSNGDVEVVTLDAMGMPGIGDSHSPVISPDGRFVLFTSFAANLENTSLTQPFSDLQVLLLDRDSGKFERVSKNMIDGGETSRDCDVIAMTPDAEHIAYVSASSEIVPDDTNGSLGRDVFVYSRSTGVTERVNVSSSGEEADGVTTWSWDTIGISADGRFVVFTSYASNLVPDDTNDVPDIFIRDRANNTTIRVNLGHDLTQANDSSSHPTMSADGTTGFFVSRATNLIRSDMNGSTGDLFARNLATGENAVVIRNARGEQLDASISEYAFSPGGEYVAFLTAATNIVDQAHNGLIDAFVVDVTTQQIELASPRSSDFQPAHITTCAVSSDGVAAYSSISADLVPSDFNFASDVFAFDAQVSAPADLNGDGIVGPSDLAMLLGGWGACLNAACESDFDGDGVVGSADLALLLGSWGLS